MEKKTKLSKSWWRVPLLLLACILAGSSPTWAATREFSNATESNTVVHSPTLDEPYLAFDVMYYDRTDGHNGFFMYTNPTGVSDDHGGPALFVDGNYICTPWAELAWPGGGSGSGDNATSACSDDDWWKNTYTKTVDGVTYTVKWYNPYNESNVISGSKRKVVTCLVFMDKVQLGKKYTVKIAGWWKINNTHDPQEQSFTWNFTAEGMGMSGLTATMSEYKKMIISGNLLQGHGPTTVGSYKGATTDGLKWKAPNELLSKDTYTSDKTSFSNLEIDFSERVNYYVGEKKYIEYIIPINDYTPTGYKALNPKFSQINVYQWYPVTVPGYIRAQENPTAQVTNKWNKQVRLSWQTEGTNTGGTWNVYRYKKGVDASNRELLNDKGISNSVTSYTVTAPTYDETYNYEVAFIPTKGERRNELTRTVSYNLNRNWDVKIDSVTVYQESKIKVHWSHNSIDDAASNKAYSLVLQRSENDTITWTDVKTVAITSNNTTDGEYIDATGLTANRYYYYRIKINVLDKEYITKIVGTRLGGSKILSFSATRGTYSSMVKLQWSVKQVGSNVTNFIIQRRPLGSNDERAWADIHTTSGTASGYSYDDVTALPGSFNEYKVIVWSQDGNTRSTDDEKTTDGFSITTGMISGNITFGTGTAVEGAKVVLKQQSADGDITSGMRSVSLTGAGSGFSCNTTKEDIQNKLFKEDFSIQLYINPNSSVMSEDSTRYIVFDANQIFHIGLDYEESTDRYKLGAWIAERGATELYIPANQWSHVTVVHKHATGTTTFYVPVGDTLQSAQVHTIPTTNNPTPQVWTDKPIVWNTVSLRTANLAIGNYGSLSAPQNNNYSGYIDEFRFFTKALTEKEILRNYNHPLAGNEGDLAIYYPFDEGLSSQNLAYDFSKTNGISNGRHATTKVAAASDEFIPSESQLSLMSYTDVNGYYEVRGVPFSGEGTSYSVIPTLGIHEFSPNTRSRYVSMSTLNHSGVDFEDVSSFPVSGKIRYAHTNCPVEGVNFYIDGITCAKDGSPVTSDENGEYEISVPIGDHVITIEKNGHVFEHAGRYPEDPNNVGTKYNFNQEIKNLDFYDETLVNFTGRVVGGSIEGQKPIGFGSSINNVGVAKLELTTQGGYNLNIDKVPMETSYDFVTNTTDLPVASATEAINSRAYRCANDSNQIVYIYTDPATGEFSAMLPPLMYNVSSITIPSNDKLPINAGSTVDLTQPLLSYQDSVEVNNKYKYYTYNGLLNQTIHTEPIFTVTQADHDDGAFGITEYEIEDAVGTIKLNTSDIYTVDNGQVNYKFKDAPLFVMEDTYIFNLKGYEEFTNNDNPSKPVTTTVPLAGSLVRIENALSSEQGVYIEGNADGKEPGSVAYLQKNEIELDSLGCAKYVWKAGLPNISSPYKRTISMTYDVEDRPYPWTAGPLYGIILGALPTGNDFVTAGPTLLDMILRDPPGSGSSAEWSKGTTKSTSHSRGGIWSSETHIQTESKLGCSQKVATGMGVAKIDDLENQYNLHIGAQVNCEGEDATTWGRSITATRTISTSDDADYVGAEGDIFIAATSNIIFGLSRNVNLTRVPGTDDVELTLTDGVSTGLSFDTEVAYTQKYIEEKLLPDLEKIRNSLLVSVSDTTSYQLKGNRPVYITQLLPDDENFGTDNNDSTAWGDRATAQLSSVGPSYKMITPQGWKGEDSVHWCNNQIDIWKTHLATNEKEKVEAYKHFKNVKYSENDSVRNVSFDSGANVTYSVETEETKGSTYECSVSCIVTAGIEFGVQFNGTGVIWDIGTETGGGEHFQDESETAETTSFSYTFAEEGGDALTVDVYQYGGYSPIFRTRAGQTSAPYEDEVRTSYYQDENGEYPVIMEATMQVEVPSIDVDVSTVSDVPTGSAANFTLRLGNNSQVGADVAYKLFVLDETNPYGAQLTIDGNVLTEGRLIKVPGNQTLTKTLQLRQMDTSILEYNGNFKEVDSLYKKGIGIVFASESQPEDIADTVFIKAYFTPSSSPVDLALNTTTMNTLTGTNLTLTFSNFDRQYKGLKAFRLQYKKQGDKDWTLLKEYVVNASDTTKNNLLLPTMGSSVSYTQPMAQFSDGNYLFRVVSASTYGLDEVYRYSDEIALVKDTQKPRPLGTPEPTDGVLDIGDELSVTFNENFLKGQLNEEENFHITGVLNGTEVAHETALSMQNTEATAQTEAAITLANKDFSFDAWVNITGEGTILSHGAGKTKINIGTNANGNLVVNIADSTYISDKTIPTGKWSFLTLSYQRSDNGGNLSATVANDISTINLFSGKAVIEYNGNGPLTVGKQMNGAIHELLLWDEAHDMTTALLNRSVTKSPSTRHLIGYWKMDEGEGTTIRDYARSRNMTMPAETWYLNNENKAISFDGQSYVSIFADQLPISDADDYALEFWMRGSEQAGNVQLMQMGDVALWSTGSGQLMLTGKEAYVNDAVRTDHNIPDITVNSGNILDNAWHHIALNVMRQGAATVYVDGQRCLTTNVANVGSIATNNIIAGAHRTTFSAEEGVYTYDKPFKGEIDEIRIWNATMNGDQLAKNRKVRFTGKEDGLMVYFPFETKKLDSGGQVTTVTIDSCLVAYTLNGNTNSAKRYLLNSTSPQSLSFSDNAPALRTKPTETNVSFTYTASDNKIVIDIDEDATKIEGCTLNFTVRNVRDENGNNSVPAIWSAFINRKELVWADDELSVELPVETSSSVTATIVNKGGKQQMWTLEGMPSWLKASSEYGTTNPRSESQVTFTISPATPIGKYEETVYLKGNNGIETPLTIKVKVTGEKPLWSVIVGDYEEMMNLIGGLYVLDIQSEDEDDLVGAFIDGECRGVAHPEYDKTFDSFFVTMNIYGNNSEKDKPVEFKAYDASSGIIYPVVKAYTATSTTPQLLETSFDPSNLYGRYNAPVILSATDEIEQNIDLGKGWNWMSFAVKPNVFDVENVFSKVSGKAKMVKSQTNSSEFDDEEWLDGIGDMNNSEMYVVQTGEAFTLSVTGHRVKPDVDVISVNNGWSWVAFNSMSVMSLDDALAGMQPNTDEIIKGQRGVAYFDSGTWWGNLKQLAPGLGYKIQGKAARTFAYPTKTAAGARRATSNFSPLTAQPSEFTPVDYHNYPYNMVLIAQVVNDGTAISGAELGIFAGDECREAAITDERGMVYITIPGDDATTLNFRVAIDGETSMVNGQSIIYKTDAVIGSPSHPFVINLGEATGIASINGDDSSLSNTYDLQGRKVKTTDQSHKLRKGVYIVDGQKKVK